MIPSTRLFLRLALTTTLAFIILFAPFLPPFSPLPTIAAPITRIFPFGRGLFEDKVANFWCFTNVLVLKWKRIFAGREGALIKASTGLTAFGFLPAVAALIFGGCKTRLQTNDKDGSMNGSVSKLPAIPPTPAPFLPLLPYALLTCSISFFLFSFQVHEKTILIPLLPLTLLLSGVAPADEIFSWGALGNNVGVFRLATHTSECVYALILTPFTYSMWPLLKKDGLGLQYLAMLLFWNRLIGHNPFKLHYKSFVALVSSVRGISCAQLAHNSQNLDSGRIYSNNNSPLARAYGGTTCTLPRSLPSAQRPNKHPRFRAHLAMEHQTFRRSELGDNGTAWKTRKDGRSSFVDACYAIKVDARA